LKKIKNRENRLIRDLNHRVSRKIVEIAKEQNAGIKLEELDGIRNNRKHTRSFNYGLNSWSFYQLQKFIEYKAKLDGVPITYVEPRNTSKECSRCGCIGIREDKSFKCPTCGHVDHADANASFNISLRPPLVEDVGQLHVDRDACKGSTDTPGGATPRTTETPEPPSFSERVCQNFHLPETSCQRGVYPSLFIPSPPHRLKAGAFLLTPA
jgi:putative transposase